MRLADAGSPDASLALYAVGRLHGHADARALAGAGAATARAATAWLERPFRPLSLTAPVAGQEMRRSEVRALQQQEILLNQAATYERMQLAQDAEALAR